MIRNVRQSYSTWAGVWLVNLALAAFWGPASVYGGEADEGDDGGGKTHQVVPRATCGAEDHPETGLQGQVPAPVRAAGFKGFNCNLSLIGQHKGDGASWQFTSYKDRVGHSCAYHDTSSASQIGVVALNVSSSTNPTVTAHLTTLSMIDPWESLKANPVRQLLVGDYGLNSAGGNGLDVYDIGDCRYPQLLASTNMLGVGGVAPATVNGHEGAFAPDGRTYYIGDVTNHTYHAVDLTNPREPAVIANLATPLWTSGYNGGAHGLSISDDGNRAYFASVGLDLTSPGGIVPQTGAAKDGVLIVDTSEVQARKPNAQMHLISSLTWRDGSAFQHTIPVSIHGHRYVIAVDEAGTGQLNLGGGWQTACAMGLSMFGMARIIDIEDERNPTLVSKLMLESNYPSNCTKVLPDLVGLSGFTYDTHYCSVDNRDNATTLVCANFEAGLRVYDIRNPRHPREIAYFNAPAVTSVSRGSQHANTAAVADGTHPDHCSAQIHLDAAKGTLTTSCQDNGLLILKFTHGVWPFEDSSTPPGKQN